MSEIENENIGTTEQPATITENEKQKSTEDKIEQKKTIENNLSNAETIYEFTVKDIDGQEVSLSKYQGNVVLIVNVASECRLSESNYNQLNELYKKYESQGLRIAAFPCNQFAGQEPKCDVDIKEFATKKGVKFDMYAKIYVNGNNVHPFYSWLKSKKPGIFKTSSIKWNFTKFLIDKKGIPVKRFAPTTFPNSLEGEIKALLDQTA